MELAGQVVYLFYLDDLLLIVTGLLFHGDRILIFADGEGDQFFRDGPHLFGTGHSGDDLAVIQQRGGEVAQHGIALIARLPQLTVWHVGSSLCIGR